MKLHIHPTFPIDHIKNIATVVAAINNDEHKCASAYVRGAPYKWRLPYSFTLVNN